MHVRPPAVAGQFYAGERVALGRAVDGYLDAATGAREAKPPRPKALIAPHAGFVYSGPIAGSAYATLRRFAGEVERVVLLGPCHRVPVRGLAAPSAEAFATPLGEVHVDREAVERILALPQVSIVDEAHALEHSLEVQLPFLQRVLERFSLVPLVVGEASPAEVAEVLEQLWGGPETLIVVSSDLSHYYDYGRARSLDAATCDAIEALQPEGVGSESACGRYPVRGLLVAARRHGLAAQTLDLRNSGDTAGPRDQVVGYGAWLFA